MDILFSIVSFLEEALTDHRKTDSDYRAVCQLEMRLLSLLADAAGDEELPDKLIAAQAEREETDRLRSFLYGLRLGVELLRL